MCAAGSRRATFLRWVVAFALTTPAVVLYVFYFVAPNRGIPTGYIQSDQAQYSAIGREHFDSGFSLLCSNPHTGDANAPHVMFQPQDFVLGAAWRITGANPGYLFVLFGFVWAVVLARISLTLYEELVLLGSWREWLGVPLFFWGGGLLAIIGVLHSVLHGQVVEPLKFDPGGALWFLNLGRNIIYPLESYYHSLFLLGVILLWRHRYVSVSAISVLIAISHPYTALEFSLIMLSWIAVERFFIQNSTIPGWFFWFASALVAFVLLYYGVYVRWLAGIDAEQFFHRWVYTWDNFVPAYALVGLLALWQFRTLPRAREYFTDERHRCLLVWFIVAFLLANHEFAVAEPLEPLHFTRGYVWTPLFLMGAGSLVELLGLMWCRLPRALAVAAVSALSLLFVLDNAAFFGFQYPYTLTGGRRGGHRLSYAQRLLGEYITTDERDLFAWLDENYTAEWLLLVQDHGHFNAEVGYYATVYTPLRAWSSHVWNTPNKPDRDRELAELFALGTFLPDWEQRPLLIVFDRKRWNGEPSWIGERGAKRVYENAEFLVYAIVPACIGSGAT